MFESLGLRYDIERYMWRRVFAITRYLTRSQAAESIAERTASQHLWGFAVTWCHRSRDHL